MGENKTILILLKEVMKLIDDGILVRNTENDGEYSVYLKQGLRLVGTLKSIQEVLESETK